MQAEQWCDRFEENNQKWLKSTIATWHGEQIRAELRRRERRLIPPRPRLYGLVGAEVIEEVWKERSAQKQQVPG